MTFFPRITEYYMLRKDLNDGLTDDKRTTCNLSTYDTFNLLKNSLEEMWDCLLYNHKVSTLGSYVMYNIAN